MQCCWQELPSPSSTGRPSQVCDCSVWPRSGEFVRRRIFRKACIALDVSSKAAQVVGSLCGTMNTPNTAVYACIQASPVRKAEACRARALGPISPPAYHPRQGMPGKAAANRFASAISSPSIEDAVGPRAQHEIIRAPRSSWASNDVRNRSILCSISANMESWVNRNESIAHSVIDFSSKV